VQPIRKLQEIVAALADRDHCLFTVSDLAGAVPECRQLPLLLSRASKAGILHRVCKGVYFYPIRDYPRGNLLFHAAALLRAGDFNYISLETVLSDAGLISQVPINWITLMSSGRSHIVNCGAFGNIEFVHTARKADELAGELTYDAACHLWRASTNLALRDMKLTRRSMDLVDKEALRELV
jgi:predicted transcriptional regulator of viral defense system